MCVNLGNLLDVEQTEFGVVKKYSFKLDPIPDEKWKTIFESIKVSTLSNLDRIPYVQDNLLIVKCPENEFDDVKQILEFLIKKCKYQYNF